MSMAHKHLEDNIDEFGWTAVGTQTEDGIPFLYTIGLMEKYNHPEIIVTGINMGQAKAIVDIAVSRIANGRQFGAGEISNEVIDGPDGAEAKVKFVQTSLHCRMHYMCQAYYHHNENDFQALQMLWPDTNGNFPGDGDFDEKFKAQLLLTEPVI
jgi:hypothetical protein